MALGPWQIVIIVLLIVLFFGRGRISEMMGDLAKGITSFKKGLREDEQQDSGNAEREQPRITAQPAPPSPEPAAETTREDKTGS